MQNPHPFVDVSLHLLANFPHALHGSVCPGITLKVGRGPVWIDSSQPADLCINS